MFFIFLELYCESIDSHWIVNQQRTHFRPLGRKGELFRLVEEMEYKNFKFLENIIKWHEIQSKEGPNLEEIVSTFLFLERLPLD